MGGLGIRKVQETNDALLAKLKSILNLLSIRVKNFDHSLSRGPPLAAITGFFHTGNQTTGEAIVDAIYDSFHGGVSWDVLNRRFSFVEFSDLLVEKVLLKFKEPFNAKRALSFFHCSLIGGIITGSKYVISVFIHAYTIDSVVYDLFIDYLTVYILVHARLIMDAQALLESMLKRSSRDSSKFSIVDSLLNSYNDVFSSPFVFDLLAQTYAKLRMFEVGFDVCCYLGEHGYSLSVISFNALIHVVKKSKKTALVWKIYEHMIQRRVSPNEITIRSMTNALCKEGKLQTFVDMIDRINGKRCSPLVIVNTGLVFQILEEGHVIGFSLFVYAEVKLGDLNLALEMYEEMLKRGFNANSFVFTSFIGTYSARGRITEANQLLQEMEKIGLKPYDETFSFLIEGCAKAGKGGLIPRLSAFNEMLGNLKEIEDVKQANEILTRLLDKGFLPSEVTYSYLMAGYERHGQLQEVFKLYYEMEYRSLAPGLLAYRSLIRSLYSCGKIDEAEKYIRIMKDRSLNASEDIYETTFSILKRAIEQKPK
ncbi:hypothetical protein K2173_025177 [Erythroxylum novogranatense]|uniref:Pentatricopeptide repeat-containing protein n=1 Tax=Erythroxylum novogranatense TaxID=1862640 RepID=A0AAV8SWI9_9ROSI|nr:hypothetical protein K2173_025177 [Erythroxylum novogranatense]